MSTAKNAARSAHSSSTFRAVARVGYAVLGLLHIIIGSIAITIATGAGGGSADQSGAMSQIRESPFGLVVLWVIVIGLTALSLFEIAQAFFASDTAGDDKKKWGRRVKHLGTAGAYIAVAATALTYALGGSSSSSGSTQSLSAQLLATPGGVFLLVLVGLVVAVVGGAFVYKGVTKKFEEKLNLPPATLGKAIVGFGIAGYVAKGIAVGVAGLLFIVAAFTQDPEAAGGLDGALQSLAQLPFGQVILWIVGAGLILYGLFCFARARYARM
ncbi:DUF1206 domain-containing protein [Microbacterium invictum]|uniref:DUF1206 domain-containing protein n=1 Tax=Microbacterium invictum TaxID=515415 RepID=A0ABZ0VBX9_9MICO|nr:DUF1206 domain-containing protein [Microbacterium invictum]WQB71142.1 DUF1206 domain-containing protein [Microbacterium invictum]